MPHLFEGRGAAHFLVEGCQHPFTLVQGSEVHSGKTWVHVKCKDCPAEWYEQID